MLYQSGADYRASSNRSIFLFGMSGVGKTLTASRLRQELGWYHYSVDFRIGTRYLQEQITDMVLLAAMQVPVLRDLLHSDSIEINPKLTFANLTPLSTWLGAPGDPARGGIAFEEYRRRQQAHARAERLATLDAIEFIERARNIYGIPRFVCDSSGSICEVADPDNETDPVCSEVAAHMLPVYIRSSESHRQVLTERFRRSPKPMYFHPDFLASAWAEFRREQPDAPVDPAAFLVFAFDRLIDWRLPRYEALAARWGVSVEAEELARIDSAGEFDELVATAIDRRRAAA